MFFTHFKQAIICTIVAPFLVSLFICLLLLHVNCVDGNHLGRSDLEKLNASIMRKNERVEETTKSKHSKNVQGTSVANKICTRGQVERNKSQSTVTCSTRKL
jgi:hypothetical protein